jgi:integrase
MAKKMDADNYSNKRIKTIISYVRGVFIYAGTIRGENGKVVLERHSWNDLKLANYGTKTRPYLPFSKEELHLLFQQLMPKQERLLLSILMTTGMRLDEAALMTWERIVEYQNILCFSLLPSNEEDTVIVKNEGSKRYIPVPDIIRPLLSKSGKGRLFNYRTHNGKAQAKASDALMPFVRKVTASDRKVVHSLRGNLKDLIRDAGYTKEINDFLTGHAQGDVAGRYGQGPSIAKRLEVLNSINHQCLINL